jgi:succinoglycan biosynthesis protein ExoM
MTTVVVCVPTYKRPQFLRSLLTSLAGMEDLSGLDVRIAVVDNDVEGSGQPVVEKFRAQLPSLIYEIEPQRGIASARNRLVRIAADVGADYVAFVDDDEWVEPGWLPNLVRTAMERQADAVGGPTLPDFDDRVPQWIIDGGFFERTRHPTGTPRRLASTSNLLLKRCWLDRVEGPFDRRFDLSGGSDFHLLERLFRLGAHMVWCDEASVHHRIPSTRATARWLLQREFRRGMTLTRTMVLLDGSARNVAQRTVKAGARLGQGLVLFPPALLFGRAATVRALTVTARGLGGLAGLLGFTYEEYRRTHGR